MDARSHIRPLPSLLDLRGKVVLVTGAASGIGKATAIALAQLGATLILTDIASLSETERDVSQHGIPCECMEGDLLADGFLDRLTAQPLHALAYCAGVYGAPTWRPDLTGRERLHGIMDVNVWAPLELAQRCIRSMAANRSGYIVLIGSAAGRNGGATSAPAPEYAASKGALHTLIRLLSREAVKHNVLVNGIAPGLIESPMTANLAVNLASVPLQRMGQPSEIGWIMALLCTPAASFMSGAVIDVNGGTIVA